MLLALPLVAQSPREFVRTVDTLADLAAITPDLQHKTYMVRGAVRVDDGWGGLYRYSSTSATTTNSMYVIDASTSGQFVRITDSADAAGRRIVWYDDFERADVAESGDVGDPVYGGRYVPKGTGWGATHYWAIDDGMLYTPNPVSTHVSYLAVDTGADKIASVAAWVKWTDAGLGGNQAGTAAIAIMPSSKFAVNPWQDSLHIRFSRTAINIDLYDDDAGNTLNADIATYAETATYGQWYKLQVDIVGDTITATANGATATYSDATIPDLAGQFAYIESYWNSGTAADNIWWDKVVASAQQDGFDYPRLARNYPVVEFSTGDNVKLIDQELGYFVDYYQVAANPGLAVPLGATNDNTGTTFYYRSAPVVQDIAGNNVGINTLAFGTSAAGVLAIASGTAPSTSPADSASLWVADSVSGGGARMYLRNELGTGQPIAQVQTIQVTSSWDGSIWLTPQVDDPLQVIIAGINTPKVLLSLTNAIDGASWKIVNQDADTTIAIEVDDQLGGSTALMTLAVSETAHIVYDSDADAYYIIGTYSNVE